MGFEEILKDITHEYFTQPFYLCISGINFASKKQLMLIFGESVRSNETNIYLESQTSINGFYYRVHGF